MSISQHKKNELLAISTELASRKTEGLRLYRAAPYQEPFHASMASERLILGGNRSGKSCAAFVELARAVTGQDPYKKFPVKDGMAAVVARNWSHVGQVVYPYLFQPGAFDIIKDDTTGQWRAYDPENDGHREKEKKPAPALIPKRFIKKMSWQMKSANYLSYCELVNGYKIMFFSSDGVVPQGFSLDACLIDEEIQSDVWIGELQARLADRKGRLFVAAMPHSNAEWLLNLSERAEAEEKKPEGERNIEQFRFRFLDNVHIDPKEKTKMIERWSAQGADVVRQRAEGEFTFDSLSVYPSFNMYSHGFSREDLPHLQVPMDWTRYLAVDPGYQVAAGVFMAVPPDESMLLVYDEVYVRQATARSFAEKVKIKLGVQQLQGMIIDKHGSAIHEMGSGKQVGTQYTDAFREHDIRSAQTGWSFQLGYDNVAARVGQVMAALTIRPEGTPKLRFLRNACPNLERELKKYRKKTNMVNGTRIITDQPNTKGECHAVQCVEYLVASEPRYHRPKEVVIEKPVHPLVAAYEKKQKARTGSQCVFEPAGVSLGGSIDVSY